MTVRAVILALPALAALAAPVAAEAFDVPWFEANPADRMKMLQDCRNDHRVGRLAVCENAVSAERNQYIEQLRAEGRRLDEDIKRRPTPMQTAPRQPLPRGCAAFALPKQPSSLPPCRTL